MNKIKMYFESPRVSNSYLGALSNPRYLKLKREGKVDDEEKAYFRIGAAVDCILTNESQFFSEFKVATVNRPTGLIGKFIDNLPLGLTKDSPKESYEEAYNKAGYKKNIEWVIDFFWNSEELVQYYNERCVDEFYLLGKDEYEIVKKAKELILSNEYTVRYFLPIVKNEEILHQVPIYFSYRGVDCKALLDGIIINHDNKEIQPFDLKTTSKSVYSFAESFVAYGYYRQCAFYELALKSETSPIKPLLDRGYKILDYDFIVVEVKKDSTHPAIIYRTSPSDRKIGLEGGEINNKKIKGVNQLLEDYKWHQAYDYWELPADLYQSEGIVHLKVF